MIKLTLIEFMLKDFTVVDELGERVRFIDLYSEDKTPKPIIIMGENGRAICPDKNRYVLADDYPKPLLD